MEDKILILDKIDEYQQYSEEVIEAIVNNDIKSLMLSKRNLIRLKMLANWSYKIPDIENIEKKYHQEITSYNNILNNLLTLYKELKLSNKPIYYASYIDLLMEKGYISADSKFTYEPKNRFNLNYYEGMDIINGHGVCFNESSLLKDFINKTNYSASIILNNSKSNDRDKIYISEIPYQIKYRLLNLGTHASVLINFNNNFIIYDITNGICLNVINSNTATSEYHDTKEQLIPDVSYIFTYSDKEKQTLRKFITSKVSTSHIITQRYHERVLDEIEESFSSNQSLLNDYYAQTYQDIDLISRRLRKEMSNK